MEVVTTSILVKHQPLNEEQVQDERLVLLLPEELVGFAEERREVKRSKKLINNLQYLIGHYIYMCISDHVDGKYLNSFLNENKYYKSNEFACHILLDCRLAFLCWK